MKWEIGDEVYSVRRFSGVEKGKITHLLENGAYIDFNNLRGNGGASYDNMFLTEEEAVQAMHDKTERIANEYRAEINSREDCIRFIYNKCGNFEEYTNHIANEVGAEKVKEFFGFDISQQNC